MHTPSYFLASIRPGGNSPADLGRQPAFRDRPPRDTITSVECGAFDIWLLTSPATEIAESSRSGDVTVVLHGELYANPGPTSAAGCLEAYMRNGMGFVADLHGSFVLGVIDRRLGRVLFATDPVNSRMLFFGEYDGLAWISTMHAFHLHPCSGKPDPAGLAHCLVNGVPMNGRTPFDGVRVLDRASIHEIQGVGVKSESYWQYWPQPRTDRSESAFKTDLRNALLAAVKRRVPLERPVVLSLSGGYDSTAILGALGHLGVSDVRCITYRKPAETDRSDANVARKMAAIAGYAHTEIEAYRDDVATVIGENVRWGHGLTRLVVETDTWRILRGLLPADGRTTFWVADECFGMNPPRKLENRADVLNSLAFADWSSLGPLTGLFPQSVASLLDDALRDDLESMLERSRAIRDPYVLRDYLYLDQRLSRLLSWREAFAEPCGEVRNPLIDREVLELRQRFPKHMTLGKCLYKDTVKEMFPDLFAIDRAAADVWFAGQWSRDQLRTHSGELTRMVRDGSSSPLDSYLPPEALLRVIEQEANCAGTRPRLARRARRMMGRARTRIRILGRPERPALRPQPPAVDPAVFVLRAIILRELYRQRATGR